MTRSVSDIRGLWADPKHCLRESDEEDVRTLLAEVDRLTDQDEKIRQLEADVQRARFATKSLFDQSNELAALLVGPRLEWTDERPTETGPYWWRYMEGYDAEVLLVEADEHGALWLRSFDGDYDLLHVKPGEWAGPIPKPGESP